MGDLAGLGKTRLAPLLGDLQARAHADVHIDDSGQWPRCRWRPKWKGSSGSACTDPARATRLVGIQLHQLAHADAGAGSDIEAAATELPPAADEPAGPELPLEPALPEPAAVEDSPPVDPRFMGSRFDGCCEAMENVDFAAWGLAAGPGSAEGQAEVLRRRCTMKAMPTSTWTMAWRCWCRWSATRSPCHCPRAVRCTPGRRRAARGNRLPFRHRTDHGTGAVAAAACMGFPVRVAASASAAAWKG